MVEQLFDFWDVDRSGTLNFLEVIDVLSKWKDISAQPEFQECKELLHVALKVLTSYKSVPSILLKLFFDQLGKKKICGFPVSSYKNLGRVGRF